jgi:hypothetical protein
MLHGGGEDHGRPNPARLDGDLTPAREWRMVVTDEFQNPLFVLHISAEKPK